MGETLQEYGADKRLLLDAALFSKQSTDPAAGVEMGITVPGGTVWIVYSISITLTTSAAAANRRPALVIDDSVNEIAAIPVGVDQVASTTVRYFWQARLGYVGAAVVGGRLPTGMMLLRLREGCNIRTVTANIDAGDNYGPATLWLHEIDLTALGDAVIVPQLLGE